MTPVVIDAGVGNLANLARALDHVRSHRRSPAGDSPPDDVPATVEVTADPERVAAARCLLLPGVGAFAPPRRVLAESGLESALRAALADGAWLLGICVGFQLLFEESEEFGRTAGLGLLPGRVERLPEGVPLPHIGWNRLHDLADHPLVARLPAPERAEAPAGAARRASDGAGGPWAYFVHTYAPAGVPEEVVLARTTHGRAFPSIAGRGRVLGTQFHPEKSGRLGLALLADFLEMADGPAAGD